MRTLQESQEAVNAARRQAMEAKAFLDFFIQHPEYALEANENLLREFHHGEEITLQSLQESMEFLKDQLAVKDSRRLEGDSKQDRQKSLETIQKISGSIPVTAPYSSNIELANRAAELERRREMNNKSTEELRQIIRDGRPPAVADEIPAEWTRQRLLDLRGPEFRRVVERYGNKAITERLNQR